MASNKKRRVKTIPILHPFNTRAVQLQSMDEKVMEETDAWAITESIAHCAHRLQIKIVACGPIIDFLNKEAEFPGWNKIVYLISPEHADFYLQECLHGRDLFVNLDLLKKNKKANIVDILFAGRRGELRFPETELDKEAYENAIRIKPFPNPTPIWIEPEETKLRRLKEDPKYQK